MRRRLFFLLLAALGLGPGCELPPLRIVAPIANASVTWMPTTLVVDFAADAAPGSLQVTLNGHDVSAAFVAAAPAGGRIVATATKVWGGVVLPGANQIAAQVTIAGVAKSASASFQALGDPYGDGVLGLVTGAGGGFGQTSLPGAVTGPPSGLGLFQGALTVYSLGLGGRIDIAFTDNVIVNGAGPDFTVFENAFLRIGAGFFTGVPFADPARVSVSQDGITWHAFPCSLVSDAGPYWPGCAGVYPVFANGDDPAAPHGSVPTTAPIASLVGVYAGSIVPPAGSGGDSFDLAAVGLAWARYVRIEAASFVPGPAGTDNAGFDLDAVAAVSSAPATDADADGIPDAVE